MLYPFISVVNSGAYRIINGTCAHKETSETTLKEEGKCPKLNTANLKCKYNTGSSHHCGYYVTAVLCVGVVIIVGVFQKCFLEFWSYFKSLLLCNWYHSGMMNAEFINAFLLKIILKCTLEKHPRNVIGAPCCQPMKS